jgi:hypothetical protein
MEGFWPIFFLAVILKIPIIGAMALIWWAIRAEPLEQANPDSDDGGFRRRPRQPLRPKGPRRDPHAPAARPLPDCPPGGRFRVLNPPAPVRASGLTHRGAATPSPRRAPS